MKSRKPIIVLLFVLSFQLAACKKTTVSPVALPTTTPPAAIPTDVIPFVSHLVISEVMAGRKGNNNNEFIELFNPSSEIVDLNGYTLIYQLKDGEDQVILFKWKETTLIPPNGHYFLGRSQQTFDVQPDGYFDQPLILSKGGLQLVSPDGAAVDSLVWGEGPAALAEGTPASRLENGFSLERTPGGAAGNGADTGDNHADFRLNEFPTPQNTGSNLTPAFNRPFEITLTVPSKAQPGSEIQYQLAIRNIAGRVIHDTTVTFPIPQLLSLASTPPGARLQEHTLYWDLNQLDAGSSASLAIPVIAPWTYSTITTHSYYALSSDDPTPVFGAPVQTEIGGGAIPIQTARELIGQDLIIEGVATMYTGGFFAGSGNTKFYIEDSTGGIQVWVPGGEGELTIPIGAKVQVKGQIQVYRGALEFVPKTLEDVDIIAPPGDATMPDPTPVSVKIATTGLENLAGRFVEVEGTIARAEEFTYSYELDLVDDTGSLLTVYIDKGTNTNIETLVSGKPYKVRGILEVLDTIMRLYPRLQTDLQEIQPAVLTIQASADKTIEPGSTYTVSFTAHNFTPEPLLNLKISAPIPVDGSRLIAALDDGQVGAEEITWTIPKLEANGGLVAVRYQAQAVGGSDYLVTEGYQAIADNWTTPATGMPVYTFFGETIPIWAIQGSGERSPYVLEKVKTAGVVTGIFPELNGFWIQESPADENPATSDGLFINTGELDPEIRRGDYVQIEGVVREAYQQTQLYIDSSSQIKVISSGAPLPQAVELSPPADETESKMFFESLEGMLVQVTQPALAVSPSNRYGEYVVVPESSGVTRLFQGAGMVTGIMVDDGTYLAHNDSSSLGYTVTTGDEVTNLIGPLAFTFGNYKIEPLVDPVIVTSTRELPQLPLTAADEFSLMTWNVENLFDVKDPHPSSPPRPTVAEYRLALAKVANTILAAGAPTIVGLQEVENIGILKALVSLDILAPYDYQPVLIEGTDSRGIDVGYLIRGDTARILDVQQYPAPDGLTSRPPLMVKVEVTTEGGPFILFVINNHFSSMSGGEKATEPRRTAQAEWNVEVLHIIQEQNPGAKVAIVGDLNSYLNSLPILTLEEAGLEHVFDLLSPDERYTYIFQGMSQTLDHILVTPDLMNLIRRVDVLHTNADYPPPTPGDDSPRRKSDHDPVIVTFAPNP